MVMDQEVGKDSSSSSSSSGAPNLHVLAVDDSLVDRKVIEKLLKISCCKVTAVDSGRRALQYPGLDGDKSPFKFDLRIEVFLVYFVRLMNELHIQVVCLNIKKFHFVAAREVVDYSMPGMTGYELLKEIKGSSRLREIPVVIMSSDNNLGRIDRCMEEGAKEFFVKPVKLSDVRRLTDFILRGDEDHQKVGSRQRKLWDMVYHLLLVIFYRRPNLYHSNLF